MKIKLIHEIPIVFQNLKKYASHCIMQKLGVNVIPNTNSI